MKRTLAVAATLCALALPLHAQTGPARKHGAQQVDEAVARAFEANDPDALVATYAPEGVLYPPGAMEQKGRAAIRQGFADFLAQFTITDFSTADTHYETAGDLSVGWGRFVISATPKGGGAGVRWEGRFTSVARRIGGKWLLVSDHASMPLPPGPNVPRGVSAPAR
ncbi:MAG TPA: SgcJ/EcaC family oxidoreductase [Vicinamibacteria bacterium]|nr:SgcJ/EcaC family oxidoreductase [Vicinamibacteria bacterium]